MPRVSELYEDSARLTAEVGVTQSSDQTSIDGNVYGRYRKALVAAFGVVLVALGLFSDGAWTFEDTRTIVETLGIALGIYEVPND